MILFEIVDGSQRLILQENTVVIGVYVCFIGHFSSEKLKPNIMVMKCKIQFKNRKLYTNE